VSQVEALLGRVSIVLVRPKYPENIGSAARAAYNMGVGQLVVVGAPPLTMEPALKTATHKAAHLVQGIRYCDSLTAALTGYALVVGTTARRGRQRQPLAGPAQLAELILPTLEVGPVALLFGPEDKGLTNADLTLCGLVLTIQTAAQFSSLNLAQAVAILCYELHQGVVRLTGEGEQGLYRPRAAAQPELAAMLEAADRALQALDQHSGLDQKGIRLRHLRNTLRRCSLSAREAKLLKDVCRQVAQAVAGQSGAV